MSGNRAVWGEARRRKHNVNFREGCGDTWAEWQMGEDMKNPQKEQGVMGGRGLVSSGLCWSSPSWCS